jgi:hypothetical protein
MQSSHVSLLLLEFWNRLFNQMLLSPHLQKYYTKWISSYVPPSFIRDLLSLSITFSVFWSGTSWIRRQCFKSRYHVLLSMKDFCIRVYSMAHEQSRCLRFESAMAVLVWFACCVWWFVLIIFGLSDMMILIRWDWDTSYIEIVLHEAWTVKWIRLQVTRLRKLRMVSLRNVVTSK